MIKPLSSFSVRRNLCLAFSLCSLWIVGCGDGKPVEEGPTVATYRDYSLSLQEVQFHLPDSLASEDSLKLAQKYIQSWVRSKAVQEAAQRAMPDLEKRIRYRMKDYESSLIEHEYALYLLEQEQTALQVSEQEIASYYENNSGKFLARADYYQFFYLKTELSGQYKVTNLMRSSEISDITELRTWGEENAVEYKLDSTYREVGELERISDGYYFGDIKRASRGTVYPYAHNEELEDGEITYYDFFKLINVIETGELLPLEMCRERIRQLIRNQRKQSIIDRRFNELANQAQAGGQVQLNE